LIAATGHSLGRPTSFRDFDLATTEQDFGLSVGMMRPLFDTVSPVAVSPPLAA